MLQDYTRIMAPPADSDKCYTLIFWEKDSPEDDVATDEKAVSYFHVSQYLRSLTMLKFGYVIYNSESMTTLLGDADPAMYREKKAAIQNVM